MSTQAPAFKPGEFPGNARIGIVAARFNQEIVDELLAGCVRRLEDHGIKADRVTIEHVPGAFELPLAAKLMAQAGFSAVICLGAVVRGETPHFEYVAGECARGIAQVALSEKLPVIFGVLTTDNEQQAWDRCGGKNGHAGERAADAAVEMIAVVRRIESCSPEPNEPF